MTMFIDEEKIAAFDKISELYFNKNFGSTSKSDIETLLFSEYYESCIRHGIPADDYSLSKTLGITQSRIRSLKERKELKYPHTDNTDWWKESFADSIKKAKYDEKDHTIKFLIQDVNVMLEARHYIEASGWYDECSLNVKMMRLPLACVTDLFIQNNEEKKIFSEETRRELEKIIDTDPSIKELITEFSKEGFKAFLMSASREAILSVLELIPFGGVAKIGFRFLAQAIEKM